jgi:hypothetical protein
MRYPELLIRFRMNDGEQKYDIKKKSQIAFSSIFTSYFIDYTTTPQMLTGIGILNFQNLL